MECPVCQDVFNATNRRPKLLHDCGHTVCKRCLEAVILHSRVDESCDWSCPSCRSLYDLTSTEAFLDNFIIVDLVLKEKTKIWCRDCDRDLGDKCADHDVSTYKKFRAEELMTAEQQLRNEMRAGEQLQEAIDDFKQGVEDVLTPIQVRARELMDAQNNDFSLLEEQCSSVEDIRLVRQRSFNRMAKLDDERQTWDIIVRSKFGCSSIFWGVQDATEHPPETASPSRDILGTSAEAVGPHQDIEPAAPEPEGAPSEAGLLDRDTQLPQERQEMEVAQAEGPHQESALTEAGLLDRDTQLPQERQEMEVAQAEGPHQESALTEAGLLDRDTQLPQERQEMEVAQAEGPHQGSVLTEAGLLDWDESQESVPLQSEADLLEEEPRDLALERLQEVEGAYW